MMRLRSSPEARAEWGKHGGRETFASYGIDLDSLGRSWFSALATIPEEHWDFLERLRLYHETESHIFLHANYQWDKPMHQQRDEDLLWRRMDFPSEHISGKTVIAGHTKQADGLPRNWGCAAIIDTGAYDDGWLTGLHIETGHIWQANEAGELRESTLSAHGDKLSDDLI